MIREPGGPNFGEIPAQEIQEKEKKSHEVKDAIDFEDPGFGLYKVLDEKGEIKGSKSEDLKKVIRGFMQKQEAGETIDFTKLTRGEGKENNLREKVVELLAVEKGIARAEDLIKERFENAPEEKDNLPFHNVEHTEGVIRRVKAILLAIKEVSPNLVTGRDVALGRLVAAWHDTVQKWDVSEVEEKEGKFKGFKKVSRKRRVGANERESSDELLAFMQEVNQEYKGYKYDKDIFTTADGFTALEGIKATVPGWDPENKTVSQPNLTKKDLSIKSGETTEKISLVEVALALADLGASGMEGGEKSVEESKALFREENLDILEAIRGQESGPIPEDKKEYFRHRMIGWLKFEPNFIIGRRARLIAEIEFIPEPARQAVGNLFSKFEYSIKAREKAAVDGEKLSFEELVKFMGY